MISLKEEKTLRVFENKIESLSRGLRRTGNVAGWEMNIQVSSRETGGDAPTWWAEN